MRYHPPFYPRRSSSRNAGTRAGTRTRTSRHAGRRGGRRRHESVGGIGCCSSGLRGRRGVGLDRHGRGLSKVRGVPCGSYLCRCNTYNPPTWDAPILSGDELDMHSMSTPAWIRVRSCRGCVVRKLLPVPILYIDKC